jgi:hypothetical protein
MRPLLKHFPAGLRFLSPDNAMVHRVGVASRIVAGVVGGYVLATLLTGLLAFILPGQRARSLLAATMLSFAIYTAVVIWTFSVRTTARAWRGILGAILVTGAALCAAQRLLA